MIGQGYFLPDHRIQPNTDWLCLFHCHLPGLAAKWAEEGVISNLALRAASDFRVTASMELALEAAKGLRTIGNTLITQTLDNTDMSHLPMGTGRYGNYDIETDN